MKKVSRICRLLQKHDQYPQRDLHSFTLVWIYVALLGISIIWCGCGAASLESTVESSKRHSTNLGGSTTISVSINPTDTTASSGTTQQFTATVSGSANTAVTWTASAGTISSSGLFTAPNVSSTSIATATATSQADPTKSASTNVTINPTSTTASNSRSTTASSRPRFRQAAFAASNLRRLSRSSLATAR